MGNEEGETLACEQARAKANPPSTPPFPHTKNACNAEDVWFRESAKREKKKGISLSEVKSLLFSLQRDSIPRSERKNRHLPSECAAVGRRGTAGTGAAHPRAFDRQSEAIARRSSPRMPGRSANTQSTRSPLRRATLPVELGINDPFPALPALRTHKYFSKEASGATWTLRPSTDTAPSTSPSSAKKAPKPSKNVAFYVESKTREETGERRTRAQCGTDRIPHRSPPLPPHACRMRLLLPPPPSPLRPTLAPGRTLGSMVSARWKRCPASCASSFR